MLKIYKQKLNKYTSEKKLEKHIRWDNNIKYFVTNLEFNISERVSVQLFTLGILKPIVSCLLEWGGAYNVNL